ncbi:MAG: 5-(carboxyamino)imidazole ribonucleotide mutase [Desulfobulbaceae bacterium]|nr:5-(carboxyamino)imidazole ribonucleotide mutase [Desulfobulbaceae bacterium]
MMTNHPIVSVVMGSKSDLEIMLETKQILDEFNIPSEVRIISAHRSPEAARQFSATASSRGIKIIIAGAGKAAHLAGVLASLTVLPVIGVPMPTTDLGGMDSLLSTVQMPSGIPVATTAIGKSGAKNAGLLAVAILALNDATLTQRLMDYRETLRAETEKHDKEVVF